MRGETMHSPREESWSQSRKKLLLRSLSGDHKRWTARDEASDGSSSHEHKDVPCPFAGDANVGERNMISRVAAADLSI